MWQGRVFVMGTAGAYVRGVLIGTTIAVSITALGVVVLGITPIVPLAARVVTQVWRYLCVP